MRSVRIGSALWASVILFTACDSSDAPVVLARDSAGIRIVTSDRPVWEAGEGWSISEEPLLSLGTVEGDGPLAFDRLSGAYLLPGGDLAVFDEGSGQIRLFERNGTPRLGFGRLGEGPGEFQGLRFLGYDEDSIHVFDPRQRRLTVVHPESGGFRVARVELDNPGLTPVGLLPDGSVLLLADLAFSSSITGELANGLQRFEAAYIRVGPDGAPQDTVLVTPGSERFLRTGPGTVELLRPLLPRSVSHAVRGSEIIQGSQERYEVGVHSLDGRLETLIRRSDVELQLDEAAYGEAVERRVRAAPEPARPGLRALYGELPRPERTPAYSAYIVDALGHLWVQGFSYEGQSSIWFVHDPEGVWLGSVEFPDRFRPTQILDDRVVGVWRDELDVQYARIHGLTRR